MWGKRCSMEKFAYKLIICAVFVMALPMICAQKTEPVIVLKSFEEEPVSVVLPISIAKSSQTLANFLDLYGFAEGMDTLTIPLPSIDGPVLKKLALLLELAQEEKKDALHSALASIQPNLLLKVLLALNYLDVQGVLPACIRIVAKNIDRYKLYCAQGADGKQMIASKIASDEWHNLPPELVVSILRQEVQKGPVTFTCEHCNADINGDVLDVVCGGKEINACSEVGKIYTLSESNLEIAQEISLQTGALYTGMFDATGMRFMSLNYNGDIVVWNLANPPVKVYETAIPATAATLSADGCHIALLNKRTEKFEIHDIQNNSVAAYNLPADAEIVPPFGIVSSASGNELLLFNGKNVNAFFNVRQGKVINLPVGDNPVSCGAFNNDGTLFITGHYDGSINAWNGEGTHIFKAPFSAKQAITVAVYSPKGNLFAIGDLDSISLLRAKNGMLVGAYSLSKAEQEITSCRFIPSGKALLLGQANGICRLSWSWKVPAYTLLNSNVQRFFKKRFKVDSVAE